MYSLTILRYLQLSSVKTIGVIFHVLFAIRFNITYLCCLPYCSCGIYKPIWADWYDMLPASLNSDKLCWFPFGTGPCCDDGEFDQTKTNCICLVIHWPVIYSTSFFYTCKWAPYGICVGIFPFQFSFMFLCLFLYIYSLVVIFKLVWKFLNLDSSVGHCCWVKLLDCSFFYAVTVFKCQHRHGNTLRSSQCDGALSRHRTVYVCAFVECTWRAWFWQPVSSGSLPWSPFYSTFLSISPSAPQPPSAQCPQAT